MKCRINGDGRDTYVDKSSAFRILLALSLDRSTTDDLLHAEENKTARTNQTDRAFDYP